MNLTTILLLAVTAASPRVDVATLSGQDYSGELISIDSAQWKLMVDGKPVEIASSQILDSRFSGTGETLDSEAMQLSLTDGTSFHLSSATADSREIKVESGTTGSVSIPRNLVKSLRYAASPTTVDDAWKELVNRDARQDMIVVRKNDVLDFVEGVIGEITGTHINVLLDGQNIPVKSERVFGLVFYQKTPEKPRPAIEVALKDGGLLKAYKVMSTDGTRLGMTLAAGAEITLPAGQVKAIDFSSGRLAWLDAMEPREKKHEFQIIDVVPEFRTNRDIYGARLKVGKRVFDRGLCIRSRTTVRYRLDGEFSRFQTWMGIQDGYAGDVSVTVKCDGTELFSGAVEPDTDAQRLDLEVTDKYSLEIIVDFGKVESDIGDHLVLGDARLLK